jgi:hypothetical protein
MPSFTFQQNAGYYTYGPGVNAFNLTSKDIANANARLAPQRQQRIQDGSLKDMRGDTGRSASDSARGVTMSKYLSWTEKELSKAVLARRIKSKRAVAEMCVKSLQPQ